LAYKKESQGTELMLLGEISFKKEHRCRMKSKLKGMGTLATDVTMYGDKVN
jgi:hypothetical protein